jgi:chromosome segregation ATPase
MEAENNLGSFKVIDGFVSELVEMRQKLADLGRYKEDFEREVQSRERTEAELQNVRASLEEELRERTAALERLNGELERESGERKRVEEEFLRIRTFLEGQLAERGAELERLNAELQREVDERKQAVGNLEQSLQQFRSLVDSVQQIHAKLDVESP